MKIILGVLGAACIGLAAAVGVLAGAPDPQPERADDVTWGAYVSWEVQEECGRGPVACDAVLQRHNRELKPLGLLVMEDGSVTPIDGDGKW